ncbi:MAG: peptidoglycan editing factor PgeF [Cytophagaceae bacterium]|nr:peptidoglycan editing factor PgeF [Cytophagaceae bacterium]
MIKTLVQNLPLYQFESINRYGEVFHYVSSREGGKSEGDIGALNLSFKVGDRDENVISNREALAKAISVDPSTLIFPLQTHSSNVVSIYTGNENLEDTDALITGKKGICISVMSADCVPVLLFDPKQKVVAAIHSGWRGTVSKIVLRTIEAMQKNFGSQPKDMIAGIGPSICAEVYEVGEEVIAEFENAFSAGEGLVLNKKNGKGYLDLWEANRRLLTEAGVEKKNIEVSGICTYQNSENFFSARKSKNKAGRFAAGIMLR